ncbi:MAG: hypothetical protein AB1487_02155 [Thermodesulfobacteriota bacterium]
MWGWDLIGKIQDAMTAVAFAEAGEFEIAREIIGPEGPKHRKILLGMKGPRPSRDPLICAKNLCSRMEAALEILYIVNPDSAALHEWKASEHKKEMTRGFLNDALGLLNSHILELDMEEIISRVFLRMGGALEKEIPLYIDRHKGITLVVVEPLHGKGNNRPGVEEGLSGECNTRGCPLVVTTPRHVDKFNDGMSRMRKGVKN